jgi:hypothetical protein
MKGIGPSQDPARGRQETTTRPRENGGAINDIK